MYANRFKSSFVSSSSSTIKPDAPVATVVAPRRQPTAPAPPPPVPAAQAAAPAIAAQRLASQFFPAASGFSPAPSVQPALTGPAFNAAIAAAQAVAARLANSGGAEGSGSADTPCEERRKRKWDS